VNVVFSNSFVSGVLTATKTSGCGSAATALTIKKLVPAKPAALLALRNGNTTFVNVCDVVGDASDFVRYRMSANALNATGYNWSVSSGMTIVGGGTSVDTFADVRFGSSFAAGTVTVNSQNSCGISSNLVLVVKAALPAFPPNTVISGASNGGSLCGGSNIVLTTSNTATDSTTNDYVWTLPTGITPNSSITATLLGSVTGGTQYVTSSDSIAIDWGGTTKAAKIFVAGRSNCGTGNSISVSLSAVPAQPGTISAVPANCPTPTANQYDLSISAIAGVGGTTPYIWKVPVGVSIVSGQGTTTLRVNLGTTSSSSTSLVTVASDNDCGTSLARTITLSNIRSASCQAPALGGGSEVDMPVAEVAGIYPNPSNGSFLLRVKTSNINDNAQIQVMDMQGRVVKSLVAQNLGGLIQTTVTTDATTPAGTYIVKYTIGTTTGSVKAIIKR
jgi:hypothetical protein